MEYAGTAYLVTITDGADFDRTRAQFVHLGPRHAAEQAGQDAVTAIRLAQYGQDRQGGMSPTWAKRFLDAIAYNVTEIDLHQA